MERSAIGGYGEVIGTIGMPDGPYHAALWNGVTTMDFGALGAKRSFPNAVSAAGNVTGQSSSTADLGNHPC